MYCSGIPCPNPTIPHCFNLSTRRKRSLESKTTLNDTNNRDAVLDDTCVIDARRQVLQQLPLEELSEIFKNQEEGKVSSHPQAVVRRVRRTDKRKLIDHIIENMVKNHNPVTEERYQFVLLLYRIRAQHGNHYGFLQPDFICIIFEK